MKLNIILAAVIILGALAAIVPIVNHNRLQTLEADVSGLQKRNIELERQLQEADQEVLKARTTAEERNAAVTGENRALLKKNGDLEEKLQAASSELARVRAIETGMADIRRQHLEIRAKVESLRNEVSSTKLKTWR